MHYQQMVRFHSLVDTCALLSEAQDYKHPERTLSPETIATVQGSLASTSPLSSTGTLLGPEPLWPDERPKTLSLHRLAALGTTTRRARAAQAHSVWSMCMSCSSACLRALPPCLARARALATVGPTGRLGLGVGRLRKLAGPKKPPTEPMVCDLFPAPTVAPKILQDG